MITIFSILIATQSNFSQNNGICMGKLFFYPLKFMFVKYFFKSCFWVWDSPLWVTPPSSSKTWVILWNGWENFVKRDIDESLATLESGGVSTVPSSLTWKMPASLARKNVPIQIHFDFLTPKFICIVISDYVCLCIVEHFLALHLRNYSISISLMLITPKSNIYKIMKKLTSSAVTQITRDAWKYISNTIKSSIWGRWIITVSPSPSCSISTGHRTKSNISPGSPISINLFIYHIYIHWIQYIYNWL